MSDFGAVWVGAYGQCYDHAPITLITRFHDYFIYVEEVLSLLPRHTFTPVFLEFFLLNDVSLANDNIRKMCEAYLAHVDRLRVKYFLNLIVLCPIGHFLPNISPMDYLNCCSSHNLHDCP